MKIKRFNNLWAMGLILFGALLIAFYVAKIFFPEFIIGVAQIPSIVKFGNYVDTHKWAYIIYHFTISFIGCYIYSCACCQKKSLNSIQVLILIGFLIIGLFLQEFLQGLYLSYNFTFIVLMPFTMILQNRTLCKETFVSTVVCFSIDIMAQAFSSTIRDIVLMSPCINSAIMTILLIDIWICRILLYLYFNFKKGE